jgi:hypothetical protein
MTIVPCNSSKEIPLYLANNGVPIGLYENFEITQKVKAKHAVCTIYRRRWLYCLVASTNRKYLWGFRGKFEGLGSVRT